MLIIALDGADSGLVDRGSADGELPALAALRARGQAKHLHAPQGVTDDALWASFQFAAPLDEHGRYHYLLPRSDGRLGMAHLEESDRRWFWQPLSDAGQRVAVIDIPKTGAPRPLNGVHLCDWLVHGRYFERPQSWPPDLAAQVVQRFGVAPHSDCGHPLELDDAAIATLVDRLLQSAQMKAAAATSLLQSEPWDLFMVGFKEAHCAGHALWDLVDPAHPQHDGARGWRLGRPLHRVLQRIDHGIGELVAMAGPDAAVVVLCSSGMEANASLEHFHDQLARRFDRHLGATGLRRLLGRWARAPAPVEFLPYNENASAVRLHGAGQEMAAQVSAVFEGLRDAHSGEAVVASIDRPRRALAQGRARRLPDLLVRYRPGCIPRAIHSPILGGIDCVPSLYRAGNHRAGPFAIGAGLTLDEVGAVEDFGALATRQLLTRL